MVIRLVPQSQSPLPELLTALAVDLQPPVHGVCLAVVLKDPAHVVQQPCHRLGCDRPVLVLVIQQMLGVWVSLGRRAGQPLPSQGLVSGYAISESIQSSQCILLCQWWFLAKYDSRSVLEQTAGVPGPC